MTLHDLIEVARYYPSPGAKTEYLYSYVALCDLPGDTPRLGGMAEVIALPEGGNGPLILTAMWLAANRDRLRAGA